jgi:hypothetical protein
LYLLAYGRIYSNHGAMTAGTTQETVDGMSLGKDRAGDVNCREPIDADDVIVVDVAHHDEVDREPVDDLRPPGDPPDEPLTRLSGDTPLVPRQEGCRCNRVGLIRCREAREAVGGGGDGSTA